VKSVEPHAINGALGENATRVAQPASGIVRTSAPVATSKIRTRSSCAPAAIFVPSFESAADIGQLPVQRKSFSISPVSVFQSRTPGFGNPIVVTIFDPSEENDATAVPPPDPTNSRTASPVCRFQRRVAASVPALNTNRPSGENATPECVDVLCPLNVRSVSPPGNCRMRTL
jgi:hypothetical protein